MDNIKLKVFQDEDVDLLSNWLRRDYILKWYHDPEEWLREVKSRHDEFCWIKHFIVLENERPIGFCQYYLFSNSGENWNGDIPMEGTYSIDYLIGDMACLGKGIGKQIVELLEKEIFVIDDARRIIVQPEQDNAASCNTLLASGFTYDTINQLYFKNR